ncbi:amidase [Rhizobium leguminosarum]|uniref:amidase n=1 Tax=Rhizobium leguminosarum TaxID=384 RepID=UPI0024B333BB|nr:amidase [Rhizobium leguminosarum]WHO82751.1 amidase [Rhizobium leguminosarum]
MPLRNPLEGAEELCLLDAATLAKAYRDRSLSPVDVAKATLERAATINADFNAFTFLDDKGALAAAEASAKRWAAGEPLSEVDGVPTTVKDIVWVEGWSVRYGSATTPPQPFAEDAPSVALMRKAGLVFIGQTTTPEFGWKAITDSGLCGITRNPWDATKTPGGSSGGAAVAAAVGAGVFHLGTDGGGSIRIPASFTGIVGFKPTFGRVPAYPASSFGTVAHVGPMTRSATDAAAMLKAMSGRDLRDWFQGSGVLDTLDGATGDLAGKRIGYWSKPPAGDVDPEVAAAINAVVEKIRAAGAVVEPVDLPGENLLQLFHHHWFSGAAMRLSLIPECARAGIDPGFLEIAAEGAAYGSTELVAAQGKRAHFGGAMDRLLADYDYLVSPGTAIPAFDAGLEVPAGSNYARWTEWAGFSFPINLSQQPAAVIPAGLTAAGLPIGLQVIGARGHDASVLSASASLEVIFSREASNDA